MRNHKGKEIQRQGQNKACFLKYLGINGCRTKPASSTAQWPGNEGHDTAKPASAFTMIFLSSPLSYLALSGFNAMCE